MTLEAPPRPDLTVQSVELRDCETRGSAVAGRLVCAEVAFSVDRRGSGIVTPWSVVCDVDGVRGTAAGGAPIDRGSVAVAILPLGNLPAGEHLAACSVGQGRDSRDG